MKLYLLRHGIAEDSEAPGIRGDFERKLTKKGQRKLRRETAGMQRLGLSFDVVLASPLLRARETAEIVAAELDLKHKVKISEALTPDAGPEELMQHLRSLRPKPAKLLLVGHEPNMSQLVSLLITGDPSTAAINFKKGGLCRLSLDELKAEKCGSLDWLLTPEQLEALE